MGFLDRFIKSVGQSGQREQSWTEMKQDIKRDMMAMGLTPSDDFRNAFGWTDTDDIKAAEISFSRLLSQLEMTRDAISLREEMELHIRIQSMRNWISQSGGLAPSFPELSYRLSGESQASSGIERPAIGSSTNSAHFDHGEGTDELLVIMQRCSLMLPEYGLEPLDQFHEPLTDEESLGFRRGIDEGISPAALTCIKRFAHIEGNTEDANLKGLGRVTSASFPRLGGVLYGECRSKPHLRDAVVRAIIQTMEAGYLTMLCMTNFGTKMPKITDQDALWERWIPVAYNTFESVDDFIFDSVAIESFWKAVFSKLSLPNATANMSSTSKNLVVDSIGGLATTGSSLFLAERVL